MTGATATVTGPRTSGGTPPAYGRKYSGKVISSHPTMNIDESSSSSMSPWHVELDELHNFFSAMHAHVIDQDTPACPTIAPSSFPCATCGNSRPIMIDGVFGGSLIGNEYPKGGRLKCTYIFWTITCTDCWLRPVRSCSSGDDRYAPRRCPPEGI
jgi:hypothetical protein